LSEAKQIQPVVIPAEPAWKKDKIVERKTVIYETHVDPTVIIVTGERLKKQLFTKYGLFKPKPEEIQFVSLEKFYEPYVVISGRYFIDYFRKRAYVFRVDDPVREVVVLNNKFTPENSGNARIIKLFGEERLVNEVKSFLIMDQEGRDAQIENLPSASSVKKPEKAIKKNEIKELPEDKDVDLLRARIARRPEEISRIVEEKFEVTERTVIYTPRFRVKFKNARTGEEKALVIMAFCRKKLLREIRMTAGLETFTGGSHKTEFLSSSLKKKLIVYSHR
jgi:hypothetical protein